MVADGCLLRAIYIKWAAVRAVGQLDAKSTRDNESLWGFGDGESSEGGQKNRNLPGEFGAWRRRHISRCVSRLVFGEVTAAFLQMLEASTINLRTVP
jgi:hypothetical protein